MWLALDPAHFPIDPELFDAPVAGEKGEGKPEEHPEYEFVGRTLLRVEPEIIELAAAILKGFQAREPNLRAIADQYQQWVKELKLEEKDWTAGIALFGAIIGKWGDKAEPAFVAFAETLRGCFANDAAQVDLLMWWQEQSASRAYSYPLFLRGIEWMIEYIQISTNSRTQWEDELTDMDTDEANYHAEYLKSNIVNK
jgi:hypothetical protein